MTTIVNRYDTWESFLTRVSIPPNISDPHSTHESDYYDRFSGVSTFDEAMRLASTGWKDGAAKLREVERQVSGLIPRGDDIVGEFAEAGDEVEVGRYLDGEPESMIEYRMGASRKPVVRFVVSVTANAQVTSETIFNRGAALAAAIDALESSGVRCEVWASHDAEGYTIRQRTTIKVKGDDDALDIDRVAFALCHPAMLRRLCFRFNETGGHDNWYAMGAGSYGHAIDPEHQPETIVLECLNGMNCRPFATRESAAVEAKRMIAEAEEIARGGG